IALWLKLLGDGVIEGDSLRVWLAAVALGVSAAGTWLLATISTRVQRRFRDKVTIALEGHVARLQASIATIAHQERPEYLDRLSAWARWSGQMEAARWGSAVWHTLAWAGFGCAYVGAVVFVVWGLAAPTGDVLLVLAAGSRLTAYVGATVGEIGFLRGIWMDGSRRLAWLEDYAAAMVASADQPVPARLTQGIRFEHVSFAYPGTERLALDDVSLDLPA